MYRVVYIDRDTDQSQSRYEKGIVGKASTLPISTNGSKKEIKKADKEREKEKERREKELKVGRHL